MTPFFPKGALRAGLEAYAASLNYLDISES
jgi:hypothetical protein